MIRMRILAALLVLAGAVPAQALDTAGAGGAADKAVPCNRLAVNKLRTLTKTMGPIPKDLERYLESPVEDYTFDEMGRASPNVVEWKLNTSNSPLCVGYVWANLNKKVWNELSLKGQADRLYAVSAAHDKITRQMGSAIKSADAILAAGKQIGAIDGVGFKFHPALQPAARTAGLAQLLDLKALRPRSADLVIGGPLVQAYAREIDGLTGAIGEFFKILNPHKIVREKNLKANAALQDITAAVNPLAQGNSCAAGELADIDKALCGKLADNHAKVGNLIKAVNDYLGKDEEKGKGKVPLTGEQALAKQTASEEAIAAKKKYDQESEQKLKDAEKKSSEIAQAANILLGGVRTEQAPEGASAAALVAGAGVAQDLAAGRPKQSMDGQDSAEAAPPALKSSAAKPTPALYLDPKAVQDARAAVKPGEPISEKDLAVATLTAKPTKEDAEKTLAAAARPGFWGRLFGKKMTAAEIESIAKKNEEKKAKKEAAEFSRESTKALAMKSKAIVSYTDAHAAAYKRADEARIAAIKEATKEFETRKKALEKNNNLDYVEGIDINTLMAEKKRKIDAAEDKKRNDLIEADDKLYKDYDAATKDYIEKFGLKAIREKESAAKARAEELAKLRAPLYVERFSEKVNNMRPPTPGGEISEDRKWLTEHYIPKEIRNIEKLNSAAINKLDAYIEKDWNANDVVGNAEKVAACEQAGIRDIRKCIGDGYIKWLKANKDAKSQSLAQQDDLAPLPEDFTTRESWDQQFGGFSSEPPYRPGYVNMKKRLHDRSGFIFERR